jgi:hypothetical protein
MDSLYSPSRIREALDWIWFDLTRPENRGVWPALERAHAARTRIELFDMAWWMHFHSVQPVTRPIWWPWSSRTSCVVLGADTAPLGHGMGRHPSDPHRLVGGTWRRCLRSPLRVITVVLNRSRLEFTRADPTQGIPSHPVAVAR